MTEQILTKIDQGRRFLVASHSGPDGDAIASTLALTNGLRALGKEVVAYNQDPVPDSLQFLPGSNLIVHQVDDGAFDVVFVLDAGELHRAGTHLRDAGSFLINIDHHPYFEAFGDINYVDEEACATGGLIYRILKKRPAALTPDVALCIYTAILADTGSFRYSNANPEAFRIAADLVEIGGINPWDVAGGLYESQDEKRLRLLALSLATLTVSSCGKFATMTLTSEMMSQTGSEAQHTDGFVNYPRSIRGVEVAILFRQTGPRSYKVGFRSKGKINVGELAHQLGGGGHHNAAGANLEGDLDQVRAMVFDRLNIEVGA
ncbi:DHH family phosphoesterase [Geoalkalibacter subterraneus]|uniref:Phosphoesterase n=1 Tax=Geoalkalibacter subterraneus TaxID=483547 RepID=A0A0B5FG73_9BACT|nr:DHH family phosphoesterase [Geoalkalibacter subterraneus]AJF06328.1 phosphoesterase [Geoalkalibacter subterraneus]